MRIKISHKTAYHYGASAKQAIQIVRLTPRAHDGQFIINWRIEVNQDCRLTEFEDPFGNIVHSFSIDGPFDELEIGIVGEVETANTDGLIKGAVERMPLQLFLRETDLTHADRKIAAFAEKLRAKHEGQPLQLLHGLLQAVHKKMKFNTTPTDVTTAAHEAFTHSHGVCQDFAHIFIAAARYLGIPARYIGGYLWRSDGVEEQEAGHAWAEAHVPDLGWVAFDPTHGMCATDAYVRVACGLDYLDVAPVRGSRIGGGSEDLSVAVHVSQIAQSNQ